MICWRSTCLVGDPGVEADGGRGREESRGRLRRVLAVPNGDCCWKVSAPRLGRERGPRGPFHVLPCTGGCCARADRALR